MPSWEMVTELGTLISFCITDFSLFGGADSLSEGRDGGVIGKEGLKAYSKRSPRRTFAANEGDETERNAYAYPAPPQDPKDFLWLMTEEPHRSRRMAIMKAHPEVDINSFRIQFGLLSCLVQCR